MSTVEFGTGKSFKKYSLNAEDTVSLIDKIKIRASNNLAFTDISAPYVGVAHIHFREFISLEDYVRELNMVVAEGANQRAQIICFPAYSSLLPASLFPQFERIVSSYQVDSITGLTSDMWIYKAFVGLASDCFEIYYATMSALAAAYEIYIMAGSCVYPDKSEFKHRALLFGPSGKLIGYQDKFTTDLIGNVLKIEPADELKTFNTPIGKYSMIIGGDANHFELFKVAHEKGVRIMLNPSIHLSPHDNVASAQGLNLRVQEYNMYGVQPLMTGTFPFGMKLEGSSGIFAPSNFGSLEAKNNQYVKAMKTNQTQVTTAKLLTDKLVLGREVLDQNNNPELLGKYARYLY